MGKASKLLVASVPPVVESWAQHIERIARGYDAVDQEERAEGLRQAADLLRSLAAGNVELADTIDAYAAAVEQLRVAAQNVAGFSADVARILERVSAPPKAVEPKPAPPKPRAVPAILEAPQDKPAVLPFSVPGLNACEARLLEVLGRRLTRPMTRAQLAIWALYSPASGGYAAALATLRDVGYVDGPPSSLVITAEGCTALPPYARSLLTQRERVEAWIAKLPTAESKLLEVLARDYPASVDRQDLATRAGYSASSGGFAAALAALRRLELVEGFRAADALMRED